MTDSLLTPAPGAAGPGDRRDDVHLVSNQMARLMRVVHALKAAVAAGGDSRERAAHVLLFPLSRTGPLRQVALAEMVHADPSTVSRHVTVLVESGLVRRVADAHDGRASQLVITPAGEDVVAAMHREREALFESVTADWSDEDLTAFGDLLERFVGDLTDALPGVAATLSRPTPEKDR